MTEQTQAAPKESHKKPEAAHKENALLTKAETKIKEDHKKPEDVHKENALLTKAETKIKEARSNLVEALKVGKSTQVQQNKLMKDAQERLNEALKAVKPEHKSNLIEALESRVPSPETHKIQQAGRYNLDKTLKELEVIAPKATTPVLKPQEAIDRRADVQRATKANELLNKADNCFDDFNKLLKPEILAKIKKQGKSADLQLKDMLKEGVRPEVAGKRGLKSANATISAIDYVSSLADQQFYGAKKAVMPFVQDFLSKRNTELRDTTKAPERSKLDYLSFKFEEAAGRDFAGKEANKNNAKEVVEYSLYKFLNTLDSESRADRDRLLSNAGIAKEAATEVQSKSTAMLKKPGSKAEEDAFKAAICDMERRTEDNPEYTKLLVVRRNFKAFQDGFNGTVGLNGKRVIGAYEYYNALMAAQESIEQATRAEALRGRLAP